MSSTNSFTKEDALVLGWAATIPAAMSLFPAQLQAAVSWVSNTVWSILGSGMSAWAAILPWAIWAWVWYLVWSEKYGNLWKIAGTWVWIATFWALSNAAAGSLMVDGGLSALSYGLWNKFLWKGWGIAAVASTLWTLWAWALSAIWAWAAAPLLAVGWLTALSYYGWKKFTKWSTYGGLLAAAAAGWAMTWVMLPAVAWVAALYWTHKLLLPGIKKTWAWLRDTAWAINPFKWWATPEAQTA